MGTDVPTPIVIPIGRAPKKAPCPKCGRRGRRKRTLTRTVRNVAYKAVAVLEVTYGEYAARCRCCTTFRTSPEGVPPKARYDDRVRELVLDRVLKDRMSAERVLASLRREYLLELSTGFIYDVLRDHAARLDMAAHRRGVLASFSGTLCVDELHLGRFTLLLATDPIADMPVAFALVGKNDRPHMGRFLGNLKTWGLAPRVVVPDGSNLYPAVLGELWPDAEHRLCVYHVIKEVNGLVLDAVRRLKGAMARRGKAGRKKKRGRKSRQAKAAADRRGPRVKEKASFVFEHRHLVVKRREDLTDPERQDLTWILGYLPGLAVLRRFADRIYWLFDTPGDAHQAGCRRAVILRDPEFRAVPELARALGQLDEEKFARLTAYLEAPAGRRVRTNNHVERTGRTFRFLKKVRYRWRRRRTLVRLVVLNLDDVWRERLPGGGSVASRPSRSCPADSQQSGEAARKAGGDQRGVSKKPPRADQTSSTRSVRFVTWQTTSDMVVAAPRWGGPVRSTGITRFRGG